MKYLSICSGIEAATQAWHSRKPDEAFSMAEALVPNARRLELFSRQKRDGWDVFGNETDYFEKEDSYVSGR